MGIRDWSRVDDRVWHGQYEDGVPREIEFEALTLPQILARSVQLYPERPAVTFLNRTLTYAQLSIEVERFAGALAALGVARGSKVAIQTPNLPQTVIAYFATLRLGAQTVMTNPMYMPREIEHQWCDAEVKVAVVMDFLYAGRVAPVRERLPVEHYIIASIPEYLRYPLKALAPLKLRRQRMMAKVAQDERTHGFTKLMSRAIPPPPDVDVRLDDVATLQYTGGTTGVSKGAMLTHHNLSYNLQQLAAWMPMLQRGGETLLGCLPYFHIYGQTVCLNMSVYLGAHQVLVPNPRDIDAMVKSVVKHKVTLMPAVPAMYNAVNQYPGIERYDLSSIKACNSGSAPLPDDSLRTFERLTGAKITEGFGLTETSPVTHSNPLFGKRKIGSIGVPLPDTDARIVDLEDGSTDRAIGEEGELLVRGPQVMKGYWRRPDATADMNKDGWLYTGDIARMDEDGFFYIVGRKKDMILASGYNVYPDEIDRTLTEHPAVREAATIGLPDPVRGETIKSFVVLEPGFSVSADELVAFCREQLAAYKIPRSIEFVDDLPKSAVLKILRRELRERELAKLQA